MAAGVPLSHIQKGLESFTAVAGRSRTVQLGEGDSVITLVDDTYNANPDSVIAAIDMLMDLPAPRLLILGDMGEVGDAGPAFHEEVGAYARTRGIEQFLTLGELCRHAGGTHFETLDALQATLDSGYQASSILVKGSRFMKMERVVRHLEQPYLEMLHAA
jgi:UDP-N-acetylmuramoyl-tripeptide--D-alanyl-D-alanine ligase